MCEINVNENSLTLARRDYNAGLCRTIKGARLVARHRLIHRQMYGRIISTYVEAPESQVEEFPRRWLNKPWL